MNFPRFFSILTIFLFCTIQSTAQTYTVEGVEAFSRAGIKPVKKGTETAGYILFYKTDKADKKNDNYAFELLDEKLNKVNRVKVVLPRGAGLIQSAYNGETLGMMFYDPKEGEYLFKAYDNTLKVVGSSKVTEINKFERAAYGQMDADQAAAYYGIQAVPGKGFIRAGYGEDKDQFSVIMYDLNFKKKWKYQTPEGSKGMETFIMSDINEKYASGLIMRRKGAMSTKFEYYLAVFDMETGKKLVDVSAENPKQNLSISATNLLPNDQILVQGEYYDMDDKAGVNKSLGFYMKKFDVKTGKPVGESMFSWKKDIEKLLDAKGKELMKDDYANYPMSFIQAANGHNYVVFEQFKKAADAGGIAMIALGGRASGTKIKVGNLWVFEMDTDFKPVAIKVFEKDGSNVGMPPGAGIYGTGLLGLLAKMLGGFDYQFTQQSADKNTFNVSYLNYDRETGEKTQTVVGNIFLAKDGSLNFDKVNITSPKKSNRYLYAAGTGSVMIAEHRFKDEIVELKLVKLNY